MRCELIPMLALLMSQIAFAQPVSRPSAEYWKEVLQTTEHKAVYALTFSADGKLLAANTPAGIRVWDVATGKERPVTVAAPPRAGVRSLVYSPVGDLFAIGANAGVEAPMGFWEVTTGKELPAIDKKTDFSVERVAFSPDGKLIAVFGARLYSNPPGYRVRVFEASSKKEVFEVACDIYGSRFVAILPDNKTLVAPGPMGALKYWDLGTGKERSQSPAIKGYTLALALQGKAVLVTTGTTITQYDVETGKRLASFEIGRGGPGLPLVSADGSVLFAAGTEPEGYLKWWDLSTGKELGRYGGTLTDNSLDGVLSLTLSPDGQMLAIGSRLSLRLWKRQKAAEGK